MGRGDTWFSGKGIVGDDYPAAEFFGWDDSYRTFGENGVVDDGKISHHRALVVSAVDALAFGFEDNVVSNDGIGGGLNAMIAGVPNDVTLDDVGGLSIGIIDNDSRVIGVVDDVVADDVPETPVFQFDTIALTHRSSFEVVNVIVLNDGIENIAVGCAIGVAVGSQIESFPVSAGVVDVIATEGEGFVNFAGIVGGNCDSSDMMDVEVFEGDEFREVSAFLTNANGGGSTCDLKIPDDEVLATCEIDRVLFGVRALDDDLGTRRSTDGDGIFGRATLRDFETSGV